MKKILNQIINKNFLNKFGYKLGKIGKSQTIEEMTLEENVIIDKCLNYSMTTKIRMWSLLNSINYISNNNIEGDFVECGVWKGGNLILFNLMKHKKKLNREIWGYDTFEGMPLPGEFDLKSDGTSSIDLYNQKSKRDVGWCKSTLDEVKNNLIKESSIDKVHLISGKVEETLLIKENVPEKISILRLDTDFYESTKIELEVLYPRLQKKGVLIIDDYGNYQGARKAVDEYFKNKAFLIYVDHTCRLLIKN